MRASTIGAAALALGSLFLTLPAFAGPEVAAEALFGEAKKLAAAGKFAEACPKFAESNRLDRGAGTMIHLADCYEKNKQTASAWATFKEAASAAQAINRKDWEKLSNDRAAVLEKKLAHLTIKVDSANERAEVSRDGTAISKAEWGVSIPVDIGSHAVEAKASGYKPFTTMVSVTKDGENLDVTVPPLEQDPTIQPTQVPQNTPPSTTSPSLTEPPPDADKGGSSQRTIGFVVGGIGVAGVALGAITGLMAIGKSNDAKDGCKNDGPCANASAVNAADSAKTLATVSTIGFIAGGVGVAAGAVLIFTAPKKTTGIRFVPNAGPSTAGLTVLGVF